MTERHNGKDRSLQGLGAHCYVVAFEREREREREELLAHAGKHFGTERGGEYCKLGISIFFKRQGLLWENKNKTRTCNEYTNGRT